MGSAHDRHLHLKAPGSGAGEGLSVLAAVHPSRGPIL